MASPCNLHVYLAAILLLSFHTHTPSSPLSLSLSTPVYPAILVFYVICYKLVFLCASRRTNTQPHETFSPFFPTFLPCSIFTEKKKKRRRISARNYAAFLKTWKQFRKEKQGERCSIKRYKSIRFRGYSTAVQYVSRIVHRAA